MLTKNYSILLRTRLHGERVPLGDRGTLPTRVEDIAVLHAKFERGRGTLPYANSAVKIYFKLSIESQFDLYSLVILKDHPLAPWSRKISSPSCCFLSGLAVLFVFCLQISRSLFSCRFIRPRGRFPRSIKSCSVSKLSG